METVNQIPADELTISIFRESYPREMFDAMKNLGLEIKERYPGIYYISGKQTLFDTQIVVTKQLEKEMHRTLRVLSKHVKEEDVRAFIEKAAQIKRIQPKTDSRRLSAGIRGRQAAGHTRPGCGLLLFVSAI